VDWGWTEPNERKKKNRPHQSLPLQNERHLRVFLNNPELPLYTDFPCREYVGFFQGPFVVMSAMNHNPICSRKKGSKAMENETKGEEQLAYQKLFEFWGNI
jgi:hypothetical protein